MEDPQPHAEAAGAPAHRQAVLVVDDEEDIRESLKALLESSLDVVDVHVAASGHQALELMTRHSIDLVISDYKMPGMNGLDLLCAIGRSKPQVPRILVTAFPDLDIAIRAINEAGVENFFTKPFDPDQVINVARSLLYEQRAQALRNQSFARSLDMFRKKVDADG